jgi:hypothetical protein
MLKKFKHTLPVDISRQVNGCGIRGGDTKLYILVSKSKRIQDSDKVVTHELCVVRYTRLKKPHFKSVSMKLKLNVNPEVRNVSERVFTVHA